MKKQFPNEPYNDEEKALQRRSSFFMLFPVLMTLAVMGYNECFEIINVHLYFLGALSLSLPFVGYAWHLNQKAQNSMLERHNLTKIPFFDTLRNARAWRNFAFWLLFISGGCIWIYGQLWIDDPLQHETTKSLGLDFIQWSIIGYLFFERKK